MYKLSLVLCLVLCIKIVTCSQSIISTDLLGIRSSAQTLHEDYRNHKWKSLGDLDHLLVSHSGIEIRLFWQSDDALQSILGYNLTEATRAISITDLINMQVVNTRLCSKSTVCCLSILG